MVIIPDIVFLILGLAYLMILLSIRNQLKRIAHKKRRKISEWSLEDQLKLRVKYLHHCRHLEEHLNNLKHNFPDVATKDLPASVGTF
jgi:uncharacterized protein YnzC (UPF0291/DUF896 family)